MCELHAGLQDSESARDTLTQENSTCIFAYLHICILTCILATL